MPSQIERLLILAKTYPSPSAKYSETSCVAAISEAGEMRRLFPVPFRLLQDEVRFRKWQWIDVRLEKAIRDHRPESHSIYVDTLICHDVISTVGGWDQRNQWLQKIPHCLSPEDLHSQMELRGISLAMLKPISIDRLIIEKARNVDWTEEEKEKLLQGQMQGNLFAEEQARRDLQTLRKIPFDFYYEYFCDTSAGRCLFKHKIVDWEAGALYWNCKKRYGAEWESKFRAKLEGELPARDLMFLVGNQHRFQDQWLIISLIYPPKPPLPELLPQGSLF